MKNKFLCLILSLFLILSCFIIPCSADIMLGDVDADGKVSAADARLALRYSVRLEELSPDAIFRADTDSNGLILAGDARTILRISVGLAQSTRIENQYDMIRCGVFEYKGERLDTETGKYEYFELARTTETIHLFTAFEGVEIGIFIKDGVVYTVSHQKKMYLVTPDEIFSTLGVKKEDMLKGTEMTGSDLPALSEAYSIKNGNVDGYNCKIHLIKSGSGTIEVSMCGKKLIRVREYDSRGVLIAATNFYSVSMNIPSFKKAIPSDYKRYEGKMQALTFVGELLK